MRFVLNTRIENMGSRVCIHDLQARLAEAGFDATLNDREEYGRYDVAVFMAVDHDMEEARAQNPRIKVVLADPKQSSPALIDAARSADLLLVSSIEQREAFLRLNRNIHIHYMFPRMRAVERTHVNRDPLVIGYHGNKVHLEAMYQHVTPALEALGRVRPCRFIAMYNVASLGRASVGLPDPAIVPTEHVQWAWDNYYERLGAVDIGIVPNLLPIHDLQKVLRQAEVPRLNVNYEPFDQLVRFKASTNPGRIAVFGKLGIPVVSDFTPSSCQMIEDGVDGLLAGTADGWLAALESLDRSAERRTQMGLSLGRKVQTMQDQAFAGLLSALDGPTASPPVAIPGVATAYADLAQYRAPRPPSLTARMLGHLRTYVATKDVR